MRGKSRPQIRRSIEGEDLLRKIQAGETVRPKELDANVQELWTKGGRKPVRVVSVEAPQRDVLTLGEFFGEPATVPDDSAEGPPQGSPAKPKDAIIEEMMKKFLRQRGR